MTAAPTIVDCHFHVFQANVGEARARYVPRYEATLSDWRAAALSCGVRCGVVVQPSFLGTNHSQLLATLAAEPAALRGVAVIAPDATLAQLRALRAQGVRGARLNLAGVRDDVATLRGYSSTFWSDLRAADFHLELHADIGRVAALVPLIPREVPLVLDHFAKPETASARDATFRAVVARGNAYVTLSGGYRQAAGVDIAALAQCWRNEIGERALLWGSDWPCTNFESHASFPALRAALDDWLAHDADCARTLDENARALYWR
jgi:predicted TIM-barrel fold metal-dependent hydrolase